jgi:hypothetical protein
MVFSGITAAAGGGHGRYFLVSVLGVLGLFSIGIDRMVQVAARPLAIAFSVVFRLLTDEGMAQWRQLLHEAADRRVSQSMCVRVCVCEYVRECVNMCVCVWAGDDDGGCGCVSVGGHVPTVL